MTENKKLKEVVVRIPSLFNYATSELSQDAFICWLLQWAVSEFHDIDPKLNECGKKFINALFARADKNTPDQFVSIEVKKQVENIDILVMLKEASGEIHAIIIEDKTDTKHHSQQLERYYKTVRDKYKIPEKNIIPIYLKTGDQSSYSKIKEKGYFEFLRHDFLCILRDGKTAGVDNDIFNDYLSYLEKIEHAVNSYKNEPINTWAKKNARRAWAGFFAELQNELGVGNWDYVPNQSGGFMSFGWPSKAVGGVKLHLQLEERKLCYKIKISGEKPNKLRDEWRKRICNAAKELQTSLDVNKPDRFGSGKYMTVAILKSDYLIHDSNGVLNVPETIKTLKECEAILDTAINSYWATN